MNIWKHFRDSSHIWHWHINYFAFYRLCIVKALWSFQLCLWQSKPKTLLFIYLTITITCLCIYVLFNNTGLQHIKRGPVSIMKYGLRPLTFFFLIFAFNTSRAQRVRRAQILKADDDLKNEKNCSDSKQELYHDC